MLLFVYLAKTETTTQICSHESYIWPVDRKRQPEWALEVHGLSRALCCWSRMLMNKHVSFGAPVTADIVMGGQSPFSMTEAERAIFCTC